MGHFRIFMQAFSPEPSTVDASTSCEHRHQLWMSAPVVNAVARYQSGIADSLPSRCCPSSHSHEAGTVWQLRHPNDILHNVNSCKPPSWWNSSNATSRSTSHIIWPYAQAGSFPWQTLLRQAINADLPLWIRWNTVCAWADRHIKCSLVIASFQSCKKDLCVLNGGERQCAAYTNHEKSLKHVRFPPAHALKTTTGLFNLFLQHIWLDRCKGRIRWSRLSFSFQYPCVSPSHTFWYSVSLFADSKNMTLDWTTL